MANTSRRALRGSSAASPDPVLAALQEYRRLNAEWFQLCMEFDAAGGNGHRYPPGCEGALATLNARIDCARDAMNVAAERVTATTPTTAAGAAALGRYVIEAMEDDAADTSAWPVSLLFTVVAALDGMAAQRGFPEPRGRPRT